VDVKSAEAGIRGFESIDSVLRNRRDLAGREGPTFGTTQRLPGFDAAQHDRRPRTRRQHADDLRHRRKMQMAADDRRLVATVPHGIQRRRNERKPAAVRTPYLDADR
jgi:hypothetical protein